MVARPFVHFLVGIMAITMDEFNQLVGLLKDQQHLNQRYVELRERSIVSAPACHVSHGHGYHDQIGSIVAARDDVRQQFKDNAGVMKGIIRRVDDQRVRQIMQYRFLKGMTWPRVAAACGYRSADSPRQVLSRYKKTLQ